MKSVIDILSISKITQVRFCKSEKLNVLHLKLTNKTDIKVRFVCFQALEGLKLSPGPPWPPDKKRNCFLVQIRTNQLAINLCNCKIDCFHEF